MKRSLTLKREALAALTADDLAGVAGAAPIPYSREDQLTCPLVRCYDGTLTCPYQCDPRESELIC